MTNNQVEFVKDGPACAITRRSVLAGTVGFAATGAIGPGGTAVAAMVAPQGGAKLLPKGFLWGTAISAYQSEGGNSNSDSWLNERVYPTVFHEPSGDACDSYHRYEEDIALAAKLGLNMYRFGIEWARIEPVQGFFSYAELDHYKHVLETCRAHGLATMVTLSHFSVPRWFAERGGFTVPDAANLFAAFAKRVTVHFGELMTYVTTFNEANINRLLPLLPDAAAKKAITAAMIAAAAKAANAPSYSSLLFADLIKIEPVLLDAHAKAYRAIKEVNSDIQVGVTLTMQDVQGIGPGNHADFVQKMLYGEWLSAASKSDFIGVQTYTRVLIGAQGAIPPPHGAEMTAAGYEFYPEALIGTIKLAATTGKPVFVTESGIATEDDARRIAFVDRALAAIRVAIDSGVDVRSYIHWSLLDNFEWTAGYAQHFGLVAVDRITFKRTPKPSAYHLGRRAKANRI